MGDGRPGHEVRSVRRHVMAQTGGRSGAPKPVIGLTADADAERCMLRRPYLDAVGRAGGVPVVLPPVPDEAAALLACCDGVILTGGDDPRMEGFGEPTHPSATPIDPDRQAFELALLRLLDVRPATPVLGICLGMQLMGLHAGAVLDQHLPDSLPSHAAHWGRATHAIDGVLGSGTVLSHHQQALRTAGDLAVVATSPDGVIEAVRDEERPFYLGVQWHPERTDDDRLGDGLIRELVHRSAGDRA